MTLLLVRASRWIRSPGALFLGWLLGCFLLPARGLAVDAAGVPGVPGAGIAVSITNPLPEARPSETIALPLPELRRWLPDLDPQQLVVADHFGVPVLSQWVDDDGDEKPDALVFEVDLAANESKAIIVKRGVRTSPERSQYRVYGRFARERHDDFAWENDRVAHRVYGTGLETWKAEPLTSSGIDVWCKRVRRLIVNDWYLTDDYHRDTGEGGDFYSVGRSRGCGGVGIWSGSALAVSRNFTASRVLASGPIRLVFELTYAPWNDGLGHAVSEVKRVTLDAGQSFGHYESTFRFAAVGAPGTPTTMRVGIGIARHEGGVFDANGPAGWTRSWEPLKKTPKPQGLGCAILAGAGAVLEVRQTELDQLLIVGAQPGVPLRYLAGAGWDGNGDFADAAAWSEHVEAISRRMASPVRVDLAPLARPLSAAPAGPSSPPVARGVGIAGAAAKDTWAVRVCDSVMGRAPLAPQKWSYESGLLLGACLAVSDVTGDEKYFAYARQAMDRVIDEAGRPRGYRMEDYNLDDINMGKVLFPMLAAARNANDAATAERYTRALRALRVQLRNQPRTLDGGFWHKLVYPRQMWLDGVYMASPFLAEYARVFGEPAALDEAIHQVVLAEKHLRDPRTGLLRHGWDETRQQRWANATTGASPEAWGRAVGWYAMAVVDILAQLPEGGVEAGVKGAGLPGRQRRREVLLGVLRRLATALARVQDPVSGVWWQVLDAPHDAPNYEEASASSMFVYALGKAVRAGWLDRKRFEPVVKAGFRGIVKEFVATDAAGRVDVRQICKVAGLGGDPYRDGSFAYYTRAEIAVNDPKGVASFVLASLAVE